MFAAIIRAVEASTGLLIAEVRVTFDRTTRHGRIDFGELHDRSRDTGTAVGWKSQSGAGPGPGPAQAVNQVAARD